MSKRIKRNIETIICQSDSENGRYEMGPNCRQGGDEDGRDIGENMYFCRNKTFEDMKESALVVVDMLYDFIDGTMACQGAERAIEGTLKAIDRLTAGTEADDTGIHSTYPILFVRDHHPANHCSFTAQGGPWPDHCVQGTHGADVHESLLPYVKEDLTFFKGEDPGQEQYSGFEGVNPAGQRLGEVLHLLEVTRVLVCGIATEYCVRNTAEDLLRDGFEVAVLKDALAWVDATGHAEAMKAMKEEGIHLI